MSDYYAVIGHPISHTQSPLIHGLFARATAQKLHYEAIDGGPDEASFRNALKEFQAAGGKGLSVTLPFKLAALQLADSASAEALAAGAANTLKFEGGRVEARNYDGIGLVRDIEVNLGFSLANQRVLILGAGGAARGVVQPIAARRPAGIVVANRTLARAQALVEALTPHCHGVPLQACALDALAGQAAFGAVVNATSASLSGNELGLAPELFGPDALAYDLVYGKGLTPFLAEAQRGGATTLADGAGMLVEQAAEAFAWWRGVRPDTAAARAALVANGKNSSDHE